MNSRREKIIAAASTAIISLAAIFLLSKTAAAPTAPDLPAAIIAGLFSAEQAKTPSDSQKLPNTAARPITLLFGGDVMLSRRVNDQMRKNNDYAWPFAKIAARLRDADLTIINLESPFAISESYTVPTGSFSFKADPAAVAGLITSGIDLVALANNHILNQGAAGIATTKAVLESADIKSVGAGQNETEARAPEIFTISDQKIAFLAYAYPDDDSVATAQRPGLANMDLKKMADAIAALKNQADIIIVIMHAGEEYTTNPNAQQIAFAHQAIDAGADLVVGHHPHWPQIREEYREKLILYSLGNLVFDQMWSEETKVGLLVKLEWRADWQKAGWQKIEFIPISIYDYGQAEIMTDETKKAALFQKLAIPENGQIEIAPLPASQP